MSDVLFKLGDRSVTLSSLFGVLIVVVSAWLLLWVIRSGIRRRTDSDSLHGSRLHSAYLLLKYFVWVAAIVIALEVVGINLTFLIAGSAALLVGLGLGLQQTFNDIVSGIIILMEGTIRVGDVLEVEGLVGKVAEINLRTSTVYSRDGMNVIVPNHRFINENVVNWSHNALETRFRLTVGVSYGSDEEKVRDILWNCAEGHKDVITTDTDHPPVVRLINFGDSSLDFEILFWSRNIFYIEQTKSDIRFAIREKFRANDIVIPFPQRDLHFITPPPANA